MSSDINMHTEKSESGTTYGGCEGPDAMYVKLVSSDGHEFIIKREHALTSGTIKAMLSGPGQFAENEANEISRTPKSLHQFSRTLSLLIDSSWDHEDPMLQNYWCLLTMLYRALVNDILNDRAQRQINFYVKNWI
ncbi:Similar to Eloc: Elongin-C (Rattus norvegicus) [Cotesia congregata]|uniref:Elongin-C n=1 Tax=Cotesia congregata TaxID=51543 RepID=A0A8J2EC10_COTCN|nr:Similar to Eloc: Elongin-C (Rattus norvegicus) [Cotesia congregata]